MTSARSTTELYNAIAGLVESGDGQTRPVLLEHRGTGYVGQLEAVLPQQIGEVDYLVLLGEEPTTDLMPRLEDGEPRFTCDTDELPRGLPKEWVAVRDREQDAVIAYTHPERFEQTWQAVVAEERRILR